MIIPRNVAQSLLQPIHHLLHEIPMCAWADWNNDKLYSPAVRCRHTPRGRANIIWDNMVFHAKRLLTGVKGVRIDEDGDLFLIFYKERVSLRFKKFDDDKRPHNVQTQQSIDFFGQQELPHMPAHVSRLVTGYQLNALQDAIKSIMVICTDGSSNAWDWELEGPAILQVFKLPVKPATVQPQPQKSRVRIKKPELKLEKGDEGKN